MCGIVGIREDALARLRGDVAAALRALAWRGRDGSEVVRVGAYHLGVARLAITDRSAGQPIVDSATGCAVAFNGAVTSARVEFARYGARRRTANDAELPLLRLGVDGPAGLAPSGGHHAFAVVDPRTDTLWLGRDAMGEKPLYAAIEDGRIVAFASTVAALRSLGFAIELAPRDVSCFLRFGVHGTPTSATPGVRIDDDLRGVWRSDAAGLREEVQADAPTGTGSLRARLQHAVTRCADAEVRVGLGLSGGIDSACIAAALAARSERGAPTRAYQFRADGEGDAERNVARAVAAHCGLELREVDGGPAILRALPGLTQALGLPVGDPSTLAAHALAQAAAADGVKVLLSGEGGDELFLGYHRHAAARWLPARGTPLVPRPRALATTRGARLLRALRAPQPYDELLAVAPPGLAERALTPEFAREVGLPVPPGGGGLARARLVDREVYLRRDLLPKLDLATLAAGVEGRCPFLDAEVRAAPETQTRRVGKPQLRAAFAAELPAEVFTLRKRGFAVPLDRWWREDAFLADVLTDPRSLQRQHLRADGVRALVDAQRRGELQLGHALYLLVAYELYLRTREDAACA